MIYGYTGWAVVPEPRSKVHFSRPQTDNGKTPYIMHLHLMYIPKLYYNLIMLIYILLL